MKLFCRHKNAQLIEATPESKWMFQVFGQVVIQKRKTIMKMKCPRCGRIFLDRGEEFIRKPLGDSPFTISY